MWLWAHAVSSWAWVKNRNKTEAGLKKSYGEGKKILFFPPLSSCCVDLKLKTQNFFSSEPQGQKTQLLILNCDQAQQLATHLDEISKF